MTLQGKQVGKQWLVGGCVCVFYMCQLLIADWLVGVSVQVGDVFCVVGGGGRPSLFAALWLDKQSTLVLLQTQPCVCLCMCIHLPVGWLVGGVDSQSAA